MQSMVPNTWKSKSKHNTNAHYCQWLLQKLKDLFYLLEGRFPLIKKIQWNISLKICDILICVLFVSKTFFYRIFVKALNKRPMDHIAHLRNQLISRKTYYKIISLIRKKITHYQIWNLHSRMVLPKLVKIGPVIPE